VLTSYLVLLKSSLCVQGSMALNSLRGNCRCGQRGKKIVMDSTPLPKCPRTYKSPIINYICTSDFFCC